MSIFPTSVIEPNTTITPWSLESLGSGLSIASASLGSLNSTTFPVANTAYFIPFVVSKPITVVKMFLCNGAAVSGNVDLGIYDSAGTKIISIGSTAQSGTSARQEFDITDTQIGPGQFYMALAIDNTTAATKNGPLSNVILGKAFGIAEQASAFPLPATATFATLSSAYLPLMGLTVRTVV